MGLEDERKMLTGTGDPKEVRQRGRLDPVPYPEAQDPARQHTARGPLPLFTRMGLQVEGVDFDLSNVSSDWAGG